MAEQTLNPGQIWVGECLTSYSPNFSYTYVLLSAKEEDDIRWWSAAEFVNGGFGARVREFTENEIRKLNYSHHITGSGFRAIIRKISTWLNKH